MTFAETIRHASPKWLRRAVAVARKRLLRRLRLERAPEPTGADRRHRLIEDGRRGRAVLPPPAVVELSARPCLNSQLIVRPRIAVLQLAHMGDFVLSLRALSKLREGFPGSEITLVCASWNLDWARMTGLVDKVVAFDFFTRLNKDWRGPHPDILERFAALPLGSFDIAVDLRHDPDTRPCLYRVKAQARAGYAAPIEPGLPFLDLTLPAAELQPLSDGREYSLHAELRLELLADAVVAAFAERGPHPVLRMAKATRKDKRHPFAVLAVGAGDPIRIWPHAQFVELGQRLIELYDFNIVVIGGAAERDLVRAIAAALPADRAVGYFDLSLPELTAKVAQASLLVGLGTGVTHLAATLGVPTVALLSGVSPLDVWRPIGPRTINLTAPTSCSPCTLKRAEDCPFGVACLTSVTLLRVLAAIADLSPVPSLAEAGSVGRTAVGKG